MNAVNPHTINFLFNTINFFSLKKIKEFSLLKKKKKTHSLCPGDVEPLAMNHDPVTLACSADLVLSEAGALRTNAW